jgi:phage terminase large subunit
MTSTAMMKPTLNPRLKEFWRTKADLKILKGGRASSKTWDAAGFAIFLAKSYRVKFLCMRQFQNKIQESVYAILVIQINRFGLQDEFEILRTTIRHKVTKSEFHFYGIHRNISEIKGFEGADIGWIEESEGLTKEQWSIIEPTLREEGAECWMVYNPHIVSDFIETFKHDPKNGVLVRHINYDENPFLSSTMVRKIERLKSSDYEEYEHIYLGLARTDDDQVVIKRSWIEAAIDAHVKLKLDIVGAKRSGFDVADSGADLCSHIYAHGIVALWGESWKAKEDELLKSCTRVYVKALELGSNVTYDSIGVGAMAGAKFADINEERASTGMTGKVGYSKFIAGAKVMDPDGLYVDAQEESVTNKDFFSNLKAQAWWLVADRFRNTYNAVVNGEVYDYDELISISSGMPNLANLVTELSTPRRAFDKAGRVKVESKEDLAKRDIDSPNDADAFIMAYAPTNTSFKDLLSIAVGD